MANIKTAGGRIGLPIDADTIHWTKHATGQYVGFRKLTADGGTWWARLRDASTGKQHYRALGEFADTPQAKRWDEALKAAQVWFREADAGVVLNKVTVRGACEAHIKAIRATGSDREKAAAKADAEEGRLRRFVLGDPAADLAADPIADIALAKLRKAHLDAWRQRLQDAPAKVSRSPKKNDTRPRAPSTINRDMTTLRAALNRALEAGQVSSDIAWRQALKPIKNADGRRELYLDQAERRLFVEEACEEVRPLLKALALLPLRPGALAALTVADFNPRLRSLRIGKDKAGADRRITLPPATAEFIAVQAKGKLPAAPLLPRGDGSAWNKDAWKGPIKDAALDAGLPSGATAYTMRHSVITDLVTAGLPLLTVAQISGTSVAMIEKHYGHLQQKQAAQALAALAL